jgi:hypothetical protein
MSEKFSEQASVVERDPDGDLKSMCSDDMLLMSMGKTAELNR